MLRSLYSGSSGIISHQSRLDVIGNNIANVNTTGFKSGRAEFKDTLSQTVQEATDNTNPSQLGTGVSLATVFNDMGQGALRRTDRTLDVAIDGNGFFRVTSDDPTGDIDSINYTRDGCFSVTKEGYLVNSQGNYVLDDNDDAIRLDSDTDIDLPLKSISIEDDGTINVEDENDNTAEYQISLAIFNNPEGLEKIGDNLYELSNATTDNPDIETPKNGAAGKLASGYLEMSNVELSREFTNLITTQRGYQANARTVTVSDSVLEELINLKR